MSTNNDTCLLEVHGLRVGYPGGFRLDAGSFRLREGWMVGLLGPNGSGKSTLLRAIAGMLPLDAGDVMLRGRSMQEIGDRERGALLAYVPQSAETPFRASVRQVVSLGRYPHLGSLGRTRPEDREAVEWAMAFCSLESLAARDIQTLSGGERQRVFLARALAQRAPLLLLDEPVSNLDLRFQQDTYERLRHLAREERVGIILADHHINLQSAYCDRLMVLHKGTVAAHGDPAELVSEELIASVFGLRMRVEIAPEGHRTASWMIPMPPAPGPDGGSR